jgi:phage portal protein BeeE
MEKVPTKGTASKKKKELAELYSLDPTKMSILVDAELKKKGVLKKIGYKQSTEATKAIVYDLNEICQIKRPHRLADLYGRAVLEDNMSTLQLLLRALTYNINILKNGGRPPLQLILPEDSTESDADAVSAFWEKNYQGAHR